jgi:hypothetical protein
MRAHHPRMGGIKSFDWNLAPPADILNTGDPRRTPAHRSAVPADPPVPWRIPRFTEIETGVHSDEMDPVSR